MCNWAGHLWLKWPTLYPYRCLRCGNHLDAVLAWQHPRSP